VDVQFIIDTTNASTRDSLAGDLLKVCSTTRHMRGSPCSKYRIIDEAIVVRRWC
jgi:hypothetical protein